MELPSARGAPLLAGQSVAPLLGPRQLHGELVVGDPDWEGGCFLAAYIRMDRRLTQRALEIQQEGLERRATTDRATGQGGPTIRDSLSLLRHQVFALCPLHLLGLGVGISMCLTILSFIVPLLQGRLVDETLDVLKRRQNGEEVDVWAELTPQLVAVGAVMFSSYFCEITVGILFAVCGHTTVTRLRIRLFRNLIQQDIAFYDAHVTGELSSRLINDSAALSNLTQFTTQTLIGACVKFFGSLVAMYGTHAWLALLATMVTPVNTLITKKTGRQVGLYGVVQNQAMAKANAVAIETLGSIRSVQANVGEEHEADLFMERLNTYLRVIKFTVFIETVLRFTAYGLSRIRNLAVLAACMHQISFGELTVGQYTAFNQYVVLYEDGFKDMANIWVNFKQTITSTGKFVQLLLRSPTIPPDGGCELDSCSGIITFKEVDFAYQVRPDTMVLKGFSLEARPGESIALVGESGAGKSTVIRMLERFYDPCAGALLLDNVDYRTLNLRWLRSQIGLVEQEPVLFDRPIKQNIAYGSANGRALQEVVRAAQLANAEDFILQLAAGFDTHPGERAARISGGQKQRVAIARAIIRDPKVLLLDEATSALDSENEQAVHHALQTLMEGKTTFIVAHRLSTVKDSTRILVMEKGRILESGSHAALVGDATSKYASFMRHQLVAPILS